MTCRSPKISLKMLYETWQVGLIPHEVCHSLANDCVHRRCGSGAVSASKMWRPLHSEIGADRGSEIVGGKISALLSESRSITTCFSNAVFEMKP